MLRGDVSMHDDGEPFDARFRPLRPASRPRLIAAIVVGPVLWLAALVVAGRLIARLDVVAIGLLVSAASFVVSALVLVLLRVARRREERRYVRRA
jgi:hypothetical protein